MVPRSRGGPTTAKNLTLLCRFHHTLTHEGGWQLSRAPDGQIVVSRP
ncbi:MAG: HNH endonuclease [Acidimicrobiales bacterium]